MKGLCWSPPQKSPFKHSWQHSMVVTWCPSTGNRETQTWCCNCTSLSFTFQNIGVSFKICHSFQSRSAGHRAGYQKTNSCSLAHQHAAGQQHVGQISWSAASEDLIQVCQGAKCRSLRRSCLHPQKSDVISHQYKLICSINDIYLLINIG